MKLWEMVIEKRLRRDISIFENQFDFIGGRSITFTEAIHLTRKLVEFYRVREKHFHVMFINVEKTYYRVPREVLGVALRKKMYHLSIFGL